MATTRVLGIGKIVRDAEDRAEARRIRKGQSAPMSRKTADRLAKARKRYVLYIDDDGKVYARRVVLNVRALDGSTATYTVIPAKLLPHERAYLAERTEAFFGRRPC